MFWLNRLFKSTKKKSQDFLVKAIPSNTNELLFTILEEFGPLKLSNEKGDLLTLSIAKKDKESNEIIFSYRKTKVPKRLLKLMENWEPEQDSAVNQKLEEHLKRIEAGLQSMESMETTFKDDLNKFSAYLENFKAELNQKEREEDFNLKQQIEAGFKSIESDIKEKLLILPKHDLDKSLSYVKESFKETIHGIFNQALEDKTATFGSRFGLEPGNFYPAKVEKQVSYGIFVYLITNEGKGRYFEDELGNEILLKGLVHLSKMPQGKSPRDYPIDSQLTVKFIGHKKESNGKIKFSFSVIDDLSC